MALVLASIITISITTFTGHTRTIQRILNQNSLGGEVEGRFFFWSGHLALRTQTWLQNLRGLGSLCSWRHSVLAVVRTLEGSFTGWWCHVLGDPGQKSMPSEPLFSYPETNANPMPMLCCSSSPLEGSNQVNVLESILCPLKSYCDLWIVGCQRSQAK